MSKPENTGNGGNTVHARYEWVTTPPSAAVVETVARASDRGPTTFGPLYDAIDPDALNAVIESGGQASDDEASDDETVVSFSFADYAVTVRSGGDVIVRPDT